MSAHTPEPWAWFVGKSTIDRSRPHIKYLVGANGQGFAHTVGVQEPEDTANANLLIAAPKLLAALKALVDVLNDDLDSEQCAAWDAAVAAIDHAEGGRSTDNGAPVQPEGLV